RLAHAEGAAAGLWQESTWKCNSRKPRAGRDATGRTGVGMGQALGVPFPRLGIGITFTLRALPHANQATPVGSLGPFENFSESECNGICIVHPRNMALQATNPLEPCTEGHLV